MSALYMSTKYPLISILICNYNYSEYIEESLTSVINQDYPNIEVIVVDDGSKDDSVKKVKQFISDHPEFTITLNAKERNQGLCYARNDAMDAAKGEYFVFLDSDDIMPSNYITNLYDTAVAHKADIVYSNVQHFGDEDMKVEVPDYSVDRLLLHNYINISTLVKKSKAEGHVFDIKLNKKTLEDYDFWLGLALQRRKFVKSKDAYLQYRIQSKSRNKNTLDIKDKLLNHIEIWTYCMKKYQAIYPKIINEDVYVNQLTYQVSNLGSELGNLNHVVQDELLPELEKRHEHTEAQSVRLEHLSAVIKNLEKSMYTIQNSADYKIGSKILSVPRQIRKIGK